jgi:hypothetical protein
MSGEYEFLLQARCQKLWRPLDLVCEDWYDFVLPFGLLALQFGIAGM